MKQCSILCVSLCTSSVFYNPLIFLLLDDGCKLESKPYRRRFPLTLILPICQLSRVGHIDIENQEMSIIGLLLLPPTPIKPKTQKVFATDGRAPNISPKNRYSRATRAITRRLLERPGTSGSYSEELRRAARACHERSSPGSHLKARAESSQLGACEDRTRESRTSLRKRRSKGKE